MGEQDIRKRSRIAARSYAVVDYPPGTKSSARHPAPSAFIYAHVLSGAIRSQVDDGPANVYLAGDSLCEMPGHSRSRSA